MQVAARDRLRAFTTKDGSEIREFHHTSAQSLAEASLAPGQSTQRHYHAVSEEIYFVLEGEGELEVDGAVTSRNRRRRSHSGRCLARDLGNLAAPVPVLLLPSVQRR